MDSLDKLRKLFELTSYEIGLYQIDKDLLSNKIDDELREKIVKKSIEAGRKEAEKISKTFPNVKIEELVELLGIQLINKKTDNAFNYIFMGMFEEPNQIFLYQDNISRAQEKIDNISQLKGKIDLRKIILAHELFHFLELEDPTIYTNKSKVELFKIGPFRRAGLVLAAGEIAAMEFAKELLKLSFNPTILNVLLMEIFNDKKADKMYEELISYRRKI